MVVLRLGVTALGRLLRERQPDAASCCVHRLPGQVVTLAFGVKHTQKSIMHCEMISCNLHRNVESEGGRARFRGSRLLLVSGRGVLVVARWLLWSTECLLCLEPSRWLFRYRKDAMYPPRLVRLFVSPLVTYAFGDKCRNRLLHYRNMRFNHQPQSLGLSQIIFYKSEHIDIHFFVNMLHNGVNYFFLDHSIVAMESLHHHKVFSTPLNTVFLIRYVVIHH